MRFGKILSLIALGLLACPRFYSSACEDRCMIAYQCNNLSTISCFDQRNHARELCQIGCKNQPDAPLPPAPYGAVAFGDQGAEGMAWNQTSAQDADRVALNICNRYGKNCQVVYRFQNSCGALAKSDDGRHAEAATGPSQQQAEANAIAACRNRWGKCSSDLSSCSYADRHVPPPPPRAISWGAIAFSAVDGQTGYSQGQDDRAAAEKEAMRVCSQRGKACMVMTAFNKQCGGLARDGRIAGTAVAADQQVALLQARQACTRNGGAHCVIQVLFCSR